MSAAAPADGYVHPSATSPPARVELAHAGQALVLRPLVLADAPALFRAVTESLPELLPFSPGMRAAPTLASEAHRIARAYAAYYLGDDYMLGLFDAASGELLSKAGLYRRTPSRGTLEVAYWTVSRHAGRGYATLGARLVTVLGFEHLGCDRVQVSHEASNARSRRVALRCGFREEGTLARYFPVATELQVAAGVAPPTRDLVMYGMLREDREAQPWYAPLRAACTVFDAFGRPPPG